MQCQDAEATDCNPYFHSTLQVMNECLKDSSTNKLSSIHCSVQSEVRYMLIIDCSKDNSLVRLIIKSGRLHCDDHPRLYVCGDFPGDRQGNSADTRVNQTPAQY